MNLFPLERLADQLALIDIDEGRHITYRDLALFSEQLLAALALPRGLAFLFTENHWQEVAAYVALVNGGHAVCLLDNRLDELLKGQLIERYRPHFLLGSGHAGYSGLVSPWEGLPIARRNRLQEAPELHPELCLLLSTSGTTGSPKMIRLSAQNIFSNASAIIAYLGIDAKERAVASLPIHYSYGLSVLHTHLLSGATTLLTRASIMQEPFWKGVATYEGSSFAGVPYTYAMLDRIGFESLDLPRLKTMTQAGGALNSELILKFHRLMQSRGGRFFVMYGQTEATARIAYLPPEYLPAKVGAIGKAIPGSVLKLYEGATPVTESHQIGELVFEGAGVMLGYATTAEELKEGDQLGGILRTGDLGFFDEEGLFTVTGRLKRISKIYGYRINLDELEAYLRPVASVAAVSDDQQITLYVESLSPTVAEQCVKRVADKFHLHYATFRSCCVERLPRTPSGKIDYPRLETS